MLIDAHCHLTGTYLLESEVAPTLTRAEAQGVTGFIAVGTSLEDSHAVLDLTQKAPNIQASLGIHPHEAKTWNHETDRELESMLRNPSVRFVGETGLDFHYNLSPRDQ
ncbi:MAG: TatD family hydrolase, partial [Holophagaceae bacterium]